MSKPPEHQSGSLPDLWRRASYRSVFCRRSDIGPPGTMPPPLVAWSFVPGASGPARDDIEALLQGANHALQAGGSLAILCEDRAVRDRCKAIVSAAHPGPAGTVLQMSRKRTCPVRSQGSPLAASAEPVRLAYLPGLQGPCGDSLPALVTGHPRRPILLRAFPTIAAALVALRELNGGAA